MSNWIVDTNEYPEATKYQIQDGFERMVIYTVKGVLTVCWLKTRGIEPEYGEVIVELASKKHHTLRVKGERRKDILVAMPSDPDGAVRYSILIHDKESFLEFVKRSKEVVISISDSSEYMTQFAFNTQGFPVEFFEAEQKRFEHVVERKMLKMISDVTKHPAIVSVLRIVCAVIGFIVRKPSG